MELPQDNLADFTEDAIKRITNNYSTPIGRGGFGDVYKGVLDDGSPVAVKKYINQTMKEGFAKEVTVHCQVHHNNIVRLLGSCSEENALMMVTEYIPRGNLKDLLHGSNDPVPLGVRLGIAIECADALTFMHSKDKPIIHADFKPDNVLLNRNLVAKLSDFGISRLLISMDETQYTQHVVGSKGYMDPEYTEFGRVDPKNDVYSFGIVLVELVTRGKVRENGETTYLIRNFTEAIGNGKRARGMFDTAIANESNMGVLEKIGELAAECLGKDLRKRPEMKGVADRLRMLREVYRQQVELNSSDIFGRKAHRYFVRNGGPKIKACDYVKIFTKEELGKITNDYSDVIGKGSSGEVYKGTLKDDTLVAVKRYTVVDEAQSETFATKVILYSSILHRNTIRLLGCCLELYDPMLVYEFAAKGSLQDILHGNHDLPLDSRLDIAIGSADALARLPLELADGVVSCSNILLDDDLVPKVSGILLTSQATRIKRDIHIHSFGTVLVELFSWKQTRYGDKLSRWEELMDVYEKEESGSTMFEKEIAVERDIVTLQAIDSLAMCCLNADMQEVLDMVMVAERLRKLRDERRDSIRNLRIFTKDELSIITHNFSDVIARSSGTESYKGALEDTYKGTLVDTTLVVVTRYKLVNKAQYGCFVKDVINYSRILHKNIIKFLGCCMEVDFPMVVFEFAGSGNLQELLHAKYGLPVASRLDIAVGCAEALAYLHSTESIKFIPGGVTCANVLLDDNLEPKISETLFTSQGSPATTTATRTDIYSFGTVLLELVARKNAVHVDTLRNNFIKAYEENGIESARARAMFDEEFAWDRHNTVLEDMGRLAMDCLGHHEARARPAMVEVARRLKGIKKACEEVKSKSATVRRSADSEEGDDYVVITFDVRG